MKKIFKNTSLYTYSPSYTFPGNLPLEIFKRPTIGTPALSDMFLLRQGIRTKEVLILQTEISKVMKASTACAPTYGASGTFSDRTITVGEFDVAQSWCKSEWEAIASALTNSPDWMANGMDGFQLTTKLNSAIDDALIDAVRRDMWRILFFDNTASGNADWNVIDGLFVQLYNANAAYCVKRVGNDLPNTTAAVLTADQAYNALKATHTGAPTVLKQLPIKDKVFWVNGGMYENLMASYESKTNGATELQFKMILDGVSLGVGTGFVTSPDNGPTLTYRGIPVIPLYFADDALADATNPWNGSLANFVIYTTAGNSKYANLIVGTESSSDLNRIDTFYDGRLRTVYKQGNMRLGTNFINCNLTAFYD